MRRAGVPAMLGLAVLAACKAAPPASIKASAEITASAEYPALPDSLVLKAPGDVDVYFAGARLGTDSTGATCLERGLVLVHAGTRILVPLLMTGVPPAVVNDSTIRARIWLHCRPGNTYDINLRTGVPTRIR